MNVSFLTWYSVQSVSPKEVKAMGRCSAEVDYARWDSKAEEADGARLALTLNFDFEEILMSSILTSERME